MKKIFFSAAGIALLALLSAGPEAARADVGSLRDSLGSSQIENAEAASEGVKTLDEGKLPYFCQYDNAKFKGNSCQTTCLSMLLTKYGWKGKPDDLLDEFGKDEAQTVPGMVRIFNTVAERCGLGVRLKGYADQTVEFVRSLLKTGQPVITHGYFTPGGHVIVLTGFDGSNYTANDPAGEWNQQVNGGYYSDKGGRGARYSKDAVDGAIGPDGNVWCYEVERIGGETSPAATSRAGVSEISRETGDDAAGTSAADRAETTSIANDGGEKAADEKRAESDKRHDRKERAAKLRLVFLYAGKGVGGYDFAAFTADDLKKLDFANGFVICNQYEYEKNIAALEDSTADLVKLILSVDPKKKIWVSTPKLDEKYNFVSAYKNMEKYFRSLREKIGEETWKKSISGVYMNCEAIVHPVLLKKPTLNPQVKLMNDIAYHVRTALGKKMMWAPYYGYNKTAASIIEKIGIVVNNTNIFDYVLIQPHYYFGNEPESEWRRGDDCYGNMAGVFKSVTDQTICYRDGVAVSERSAGATAKIGIQMEIDGGVASKDEYRARDAELRAKFKSLLDSADFSYFAGDRDEIINNGLYENMKEFYSEKSGK